MRVLTLNLWGRRGQWSRRRELLVEGLRAIDPDLVAFQESIKTDEYDQVRDLLGQGYHHAHQAVREPGGPDDVEPGQGVSVASRWPFEDVRELDLHVTPRTLGFACGALLASIQVPAPIGKVLFVNHFPNWQLAFEYERELQAVMVAREVEGAVAMDPSHVVVAGDLDADPTAASIRFWTGRQSLGGLSVCYRDVWERCHPNEPGHTFTARNPLMNSRDWPFGRIDYIMVRCGLHGGATLEIEECSLTFDAPTEGMSASDHFGVVADLDAPAG